MTEKGKPLPYPLDECAGCRDLTQQLATAIAERDASQEIVRKIAAGMAPMEALVSGMGMVVKLEQQLAAMTQERDEAVRIAKELMEPSPVTKADVKQAQGMAIFLNQKLAKLTQERDEAKKE